MKVIDDNNLMMTAVIQACMESGSRLFTRTPILSKHDFRGCTVESVIDDSPEEKFAADYEIKAQKYTKI